MRFATIASALCILVPGCAQIHWTSAARWPHKDVAQISISIDEPLDVEDYRRVAREALATLPASPFTPPSPLYEVRCGFLVHSAASSTVSLVAEVRFGGDERAGDSVESTEQLVLYHHR